MQVGVVDVSIGIAAYHTVQYSHCSHLLASGSPFSV